MARQTPIDLKSLPGKKTLWAWAIGTFFGAGLMRPGPGTWGSAAAALLWFGAAVGLHRSPASLMFLTFLAAFIAIAVGIPAAHGLDWGKRYQYLDDTVRACRALWTGEFTTFETGHVRPLALSSDGTRLYAVNTPDNRVEEIISAIVKHAKAGKIGDAKIFVFPVEEYLFARGLEEEFGHRAAREVRHPDIAASVDGNAYGMREASSGIARGDDGIIGG